jgi:hypothetical protein
LPHHSVTASKRATATEVNKCSDQLAIFEGSENEGLGRTTRVCVNFASNSGKLLLKRGKSFNKPSDMNV